MSKPRSGSTFALTVCGSDLEMHHRSRIRNEFNPDSQDSKEDISLSSLGSREGEGPQARGLVLHNHRVVEVQSRFEVRLREDRPDRRLVEEVADVEDEGVPVDVGLAPVMPKE